VEHVKKRDETAAAAVEFALVLPILVAFLFGIIAFGVIFAQDLALGNSARQAARVGVVEDRTCADIEREIDESIDTIGIDDSADLTGVSITRNGVSACGSEDLRPCTGAAEGDNIRVVLTYQAKPMVPVPGVDTVEITGKGQFRCEYH